MGEPLDDSNVSLCVSSRVGVFQEVVQQSPRWWDRQSHDEKIKRELVNNEREIVESADR